MLESELQHLTRFCCLGIRVCVRLSARPQTPPTHTQLTASSQMHACRRCSAACSNLGMYCLLVLHGCACGVAVKGSPLAAIRMTNYIVQLFLCRHAWVKYTDCHPGMNEAFYNLHESHYHYQATTLNCCRHCSLCMFGTVHTYIQTFDLQCLSFAVAYP